MAVLVDLMGGALREIELAPHTTLGRDPGNTVPLPDPLVSRRHAEIRLTAEGRYRLIDLGSRGGTFLGGHRIQEATLNDGDEILIGIYRLRFESRVAPTADLGAPSESERRPRVKERMAIPADERFPPASQYQHPQLLARDYEKLRAAFELTRSIGVEHDLRTQLERILAAAFELLPADRGTIVLLVPETGQPTLQVSKRRTGENDRIILSRSLVAEVASTRAGVITSDAGIDERFMRSGSIFKQGIRSAMCVPMLHHGELLGIIYLDSQVAVNAFQAKDLELFTAISNQAALAIKSATLVQRIREVMAEERYRLEHIVESLPEGVLLLGSGGRIEHANKLAEELLPLLSPARKGEVLRALDVVPLDDVLERAGEDPLEIVHAGPPRRVIAVRAASVPQGRGAEAVLVLRDVTAERDREEQAARQERLLLVGQLVSGIAHDFNNLLSVVLGYAPLAAEDQDMAQRQEHAATIERAALGAAALVRQLLAFSRREVVRPKIISLNPLVAETQTLLRRTLDKRIEMQTELAPDLWPVKVDPTKIEQVLVNLIVNARDAMPRGGRLTISTSNVKPREHGGRLVELAVRDEGTGMSPEIAARIFEPFFTTKAKGRGTGLGLSTVHAIVQEAGGRIAVESEPGKGSTFRISLPATDELAAPEETPERPKVRGGNEIVLVVDDEEAVLASTAHILRNAGYKVHEATSGEEALAISGQTTAAIDLLLLDVVMPSRAGRQLAEALCRERPNLRVLYVSGDPDAVTREVLPQAAPFLAKPFDRDALLLKVREVLDGGASSR